MIDLNKKIIFKIFDANIIKVQHSINSKKIIIKNKKILISHKEGFLECKVMQFPNKKMMTGIEIINGHRFSSKVRVK